MSLYRNADAVFTYGSMGVIFDAVMSGAEIDLKGRPEGGCMLIDMESAVLGPVIVAPTDTPFGELGVEPGSCHLVMVVDDRDNSFVVYRGSGERADILFED